MALPGQHSISDIMRSPKKRNFTKNTDPSQLEEKNQTADDVGTRKKRFTTNKDKREHKFRNFKNRNGNRARDNSSQNRDEELREDVDNDQISSGIPVEEQAKEPRKPKKKVAILLGFCGTGYQGMQINRNAKTIEDEVFKALVAAGAVSRDNSDDPKKVSLMRAARTDKGVHAAGNIISIKIIERINENLPEQIRLWGYVRTIRSFHAKTLCDSRVYEYLIPTYVFIPNETIPSVQISQSNSIIINQSEEFQAEGTASWQKIEAPVATAEEMLEKRKFRISPEILNLVRQGFKEYEGTHNYHNFTIGRASIEKSCHRFIINFEVSEPKMVKDTEWLSLKVHGQSFMLHQIRKMVALVVMVVRTGTPLTLISKAFGLNKINIPNAPAPVFKSYNKKCVSNGNELIDFEKYREKIDEFKEKYIYSKIYEEEHRDNTFQNWLNTLDTHKERDFGYLNPEGDIPEWAVVKKQARFPNEDAESQEEDTENDDD
ncbi:1331_t:CDS:10 [Acaulospora morrowiae]|uniref:1331_t:CDS:1 n=1 Tax=Acaulospora morrowiae TaxID=94023 RepID=A0A9N8Z9X2_9GLOM|nr:1331_t:CDS:10 [Acaulospora morrowiae]